MVAIRFMVDLTLRSVRGILRVHKVDIALYYSVKYLKKEGGTESVFKKVAVDTE